MQKFQIIDNKLSVIKETGSYQEIEATYLDAKEVAVPIKVQVPIITFEEVSPDPVSQVVSNMNFDLANLKAEVNAKIAEFNKKVAEIKAIKTDIPEIGLAEETVMEAMK